MTKKFLNLMIVVCVFGLIGGCAHRTKNQVEPITSPELKEEEAVEVVQAEEEVQPPAIPQQEPQEPAEEELNKTLVANEYPGIEGKFLESSRLLDVHFAFDRSELSEEARLILNETAALLKEFPKVKIQIEGHCDERGPTDYNLALGERRSASVRDYLISLGIPSQRLSTISYGEEMPLDLGHNEEAWAKNRRAHMIITEK
jgi:peptidoglycan-associated lipoprotein